MTQITVKNYILKSRFSTLQETLNHIKEIHVTVDSIVKCTSTILPKNFHDQDKTEDIVKRFRKMFV